MHIGILHIIRGKSKRKKDQREEDKWGKREGVMEREGIVEVRDSISDFCMEARYNSDIIFKRRAAYCT